MNWVVPMSDYVKLQSELADAYNRAVNLLYRVALNLADVLLNGAA